MRGDNGFVFEEKLTLKDLQLNGWISFDNVLSEIRLVVVAKCPLPGL